MQQIIKQHQESDNKIANKILCKSMPRSGHHFSISLLETIINDEFSYCPFYNHEKCCGNQPCENQYSGLLFIQKSHDFQLEDSILLADTYKFLIQYRHPIPRLFSDWKLFLRKSGKPDDFQTFEKFAIKRKKYYIGFFEKWIIPFRNNENFFLMSYESLIGEPIKVMQNFLRFALNRPSYLIDKNILIQSEKNINAPRRFDNHKYYIPEFLNDYQMSIIEAIPELPYLPWSL